MSTIMALANTRDVIITKPITALNIEQEERRTKKGKESLQETKPSTSITSVPHTRQSHVRFLRGVGIPLRVLGSPTSLIHLHCIRGNAE